MFLFYGLMWCARVFVEQVSAICLSEVLVMRSEIMLGTAVYRTGTYSGVRGGWSINGQPST